jgi:hypothetical protein
MLKFATFNNEIDEIKRTRENKKCVYQKGHFINSYFYYVVNWLTIALDDAKVKEIACQA